MELDFARTPASWRAEQRILLAVVAGLVAGGLALLFLHARPASAVTTPPGFTHTLVTSVGSPTALAFTPDERLLVTTQDGKLRVYENGTLLPKPALDLSSNVCTNGANGLLGVAVDPNFATNHYVYLYYTFNNNGNCPGRGVDNTNNPVNRVSRFILSGNAVDAASERVLVETVPLPAPGHNAGDLHFGKDGYLYISVGDAHCDYAGDSECAGANDAARDTHVLLGKILRITRNGGIPATNPYTGTDSARCNLTGRTEVGKKCQETFASGLRNPFRFAFDPNASGTRFFINDVGQEGWEEIDEGRSGADYAWNLCEGNHDNPDMPGSVNCAALYTPPIHEYSHGTGCSSITGGAFAPNGVWPAEYDDSYLLGDYVCGKIFKLTPDGAGGFTQTEFASGLGEGGPIAMAFGPYEGGQALYYTTYANGGEVHRIAYSGDPNANRPPTAAFVANPTDGLLPLAVDFDGSGSSDPDAGDALTSYIWSFGDGSPTQTTTTPTTSHIYSTDGAYTASLRVKDDKGAVSDPATVRIDAGNEAPTSVIESPSPNLLFRVDQQITLRGSATDPEDGQLADAALNWEVRLHHNGNHWHPFFSAAGNNLTFTAPRPENLSATGPGNYLEIRFTATDSEGLSKSITQELHANRVNLTFESKPSGLSLSIINGVRFAAPRTFISWEGYGLNLNAPSPQTLSGTTYQFSSWSDGKAQQHDIVTGAAPSTYTATFRDTTSDTTAPKVTSTDPTANATGVDVTTDVAATFSEDMDTSSITGQTFKLFKKGTTTKIAATVSYPDPNGPPYTAKLDPSNSLKRGATYKVVVTTGTKDLARNPLAQQYRWFFGVR